MSPRDMYITGLKPPPFKNRHVLLFVACFYSLLAFIVAVHAVAMFCSLVWMLLLQLLMRMLLMFLMAFHSL